jgi:hypothetical protein
MSQALDSTAFGPPIDHSVQKLENIEPVFGYLEWLRIS